MVLVEQKHLTYCDTINYGSYYTPEKVIDIIYKMLLDNINNFSYYKILDTSCGYGSFLKFKNSIGADIDSKALQIAQENCPHAQFFNTNSLQNVSRSKYGLKTKDNLIIVGNPPYNDTTSIIRNSIKQYNFEIDSDLKTRDLGISFILSYNKLSADYICILHPLSYLIKKTNFETLGNFKKQYRLKDCVVISSGEFSATSKSTQFPILIALYEKNPLGMDYNFIETYQFKTINGKKWLLNQFDKISNYITKYPNQNYVNIKDTVAYFWTMRDINALKRTKSFVDKESYNTIRIMKNNFEYYCYVDVFKEYIKHIPYYFGNSEIMINDSEFQKIKDVFINRSLSKYSFIKYNRELLKVDTSSDILISKYFKDLLEEHYVD